MVHKESDAHSTLGSAQPQDAASHEPKMVRKINSTKEAGIAVNKFISTAAKVSK